jgi:hypothetical protein
MNEPKRTCQILHVREIAEYLGCNPDLARIALRRLASGNYDIELSPGVMVHVVDVKVEPSTKSRLRPGEGLVAAAVDSATSVAELKQILAAALPASRRIQ